MSDLVGNPEDRFSRVAAHYELISGILGKVLLSFSVYTNVTKLLNTNQPAGTLSSINGIRFLSMTWVMLGHSYGFGISVAGNGSMIIKMLFPLFVELQQLYCGE